MSCDRTFLKKAILGLLNAVAREQPPGHQESKAGRYVLISKDGAEIELMFEKNDMAPPNIWCLEVAAGEALIATLSPRRSPAAGLRKELGAKGELLYGRHSALERMRRGCGPCVLHPGFADASRPDH